MCRHRLAAKDGPPEIRIDNALPVCIFQPQKQGIKRHPRIIDKDIDAALLLSQLLDGKTHCLPVRHIKSPGLSLPACFPDQAQGFRSGRSVLQEIDAYPGPGRFPWICRLPRLFAPAGTMQPLHRL
jgi:hypothetical protein